MSDGVQELTRIRLEYARRQELLGDAHSLAKPANRFFRSGVARSCLEMLIAHEVYPLEGRKICDIGCGRGDWLLHFALWGALGEDLFGIDLDEGRVGEARRRLPDAAIEAGDARDLPWPDESFDIVSQFVVFTSILNPVFKAQLAAEMARVVKPGGLILWYDFHVDNPRNPNVKGIRWSEIRRLFPGYRIDARSVTLAPPIARAVVPSSWPLATLLETIPFLRTHTLAVIRK